MTAAKTPKDENFLSHSVQFGGFGAAKDPETVALIDEIGLTDIEYRTDGSKLPRSIAIRVIAEATDLFIANLQKALAASLPACDTTYDPQSRQIVVSPRSGAVTSPMIMRVLGVLYKQQAVIFKEIVTASNTIGVTPPPQTLDTVKRDLTDLWNNPNAQTAENYIFCVPYFRFNPNLRLARGPALVDRIELNLERGARQSPYVTLHISHKATDLLIANIQTALQETINGKHYYDGGSRNFTVVPPSGNVSKDHMSRILEVLYETRAISYNDRADACDALKLAPLAKDTIKSKEKRNLTGLCK